jgi:DnaJ-class molecular chaperone
MMQECFADEIAIDFPSVECVVDRMRDAFLGERHDADVLRAELSLSQREAVDGLVVPLEVPVRATCPNCGGRGETWANRRFSTRCPSRCRPASPTARGSAFE